MTNTDIAPAPHDSIDINGYIVRVEYVGTGAYSIAVVSPYGDRFEIDRAELTLAAPAVRGGTPAVWTCWTDADGRRA